MADGGHWISYTNGDLDTTKLIASLARCYWATPTTSRPRSARATGNTEVTLTQRATSIKTLEWKRIHQTLVETGFSISEAARRLGIHRRTLTRKLEKQQVK